MGGSGQGKTRDARRTAFRFRNVESQGSILMIHEIDERSQATFREIASGLAFPEGPVAMEDRSLLVVEVAAGRITCVKPDGKKSIVSEPGGGPNGLAIGPDGAL